MTGGAVLSYGEARPTLPGSSTLALSSLRDWVTAATDAEALVTMLVDTPFMPKSHWPDVGQGKNDMSPAQRQQARPIAIATGTAAVLQGITLGLDPLTALARIYVVHGVPGLYAKLKVALVQSRGHEIWTEDNTDDRAVVCGRRRGTDTIERVTITMAAARKAGWTRNPTYEKTPADMLWSRAAGRVSDRIGGDALHGLPTAEDLTDPEVDDSTGEAAPRRVAAPRRRAAVTAPAEPESPGSGAAAAAPEAYRRSVAGPDGYATARQAAVPPAADTGSLQIVDAEWRAINTRFVELGVEGEGSRANRLSVIRAIVDAPIARGSELTRRQARMVLDNLAGDGGHRIVREVLRGETPASEQTATEQPASEQQPADDDQGAGEHDPTADEDWPGGRGFEDTEGGEQA